MWRHFTLSIGLRKALLYLAFFHHFAFYGLGLAIIFLPNELNSMWICLYNRFHHYHSPQPFYGPFSRTTRVSRCQQRTSGPYGAERITRGRHADYPAGRHSIRTTRQCPPPPSPIIYRTDALSAAQPWKIIDYLKYNRFQLIKIDNPMSSPNIS